MTRFQRIRIIERIRKLSHTERLEARARRIVVAQERAPPQSSAVRSLVAQIALVLDELDRLRKTHQRVRGSLLRQQLYIDTEIIQREPRPPVYADPRLPERDMLRGRLMTLEAERRRMLLVEDSELRHLYARLSELVGRWQTLGAIA